MVEGARLKSVVSGIEENRAILIGCKCGIPPNVAIICYSKKDIARGTIAKKLRYVFGF